MKLVSFRVINYRNIEDTDEIAVDPSVTCFVGKNESGKTTILQALHRANPVSNATFDVTNDYPRKRLREYERRLERKEPHDTVVKVKYELDDADLKLINEKFGNSVSSKACATLSVNYANKKFISLAADEAAFVSHTVVASNLSVATTKKCEGATSVASLLAALKGSEEEAGVTDLVSRLTAIQNAGLGVTIWNEVLDDRAPKSLYFSDYRLMAGKATLDDLATKTKLDTNESLQTLRDLLDLAGVTPEALKNDTNYEHHKANLESTENEISEKVFEYWKQNTNLEVEFDVHRPAAANNVPATFYVRIKNTRHKVTVPFDERSRGFVWFFSFLVAFRKVAADNENLIILLDEPGLNLHASAQDDLLRFIDQELAEKGHQILYSTHSPFMIKSTDLLRVRTVEDTQDKGCVVSGECLSTDSSTVFPLQAALSYSLAQTLFLGPNCLLVEGPSDLLYLQVMSALAKEAKKTSLDPRWVITPVGGADRLSTFASIITANQLNVCALLDFAANDEQKIKNLITRGCLKETSVLHYRDFIGGKEADVEDMFSVDTYLKLVGRCFPNLTLAAADLKPGPRVVKRVEKALAERGVKGFNHTTPAKHATREFGKAITVEDETVTRFAMLFEKINGLLQ